MTSAMVRGDALDLPLRPGSVQLVVTSPPYPRQRRYGDSLLELGLEETVEDFVRNLANVFDEVRRALRSDGLLFLNIGDRANFSGGAGGDWSKARQRKAKGGGPLPFRDPAFEPQSFVDAPGALVQELLRRDWRLRLPIVWNKGVQGRESLVHVGRPRWQHEMIYMLAPTRTRPKAHPERLVERGSVWTFPPGGEGDPHLAPFPDELAIRCITLGSDPGDVVFDPFAGSGTVPRVAEKMGRIGVGTDLYAGLFNQVEPPALERPEPLVG